MAINRRLTLAVLAATIAAPALAQDWKAKYPELVFAAVPAENASGTLEKHKGFIEYMTRELGVKVTIRIASDYAAVIEGHRAGNIHFAEHGPSSYIRAHTVTNGGVEPFATPLDANGNTGYYSVAWAKSSAAGTKLEDFKGKNLCLVDPNSTSGNNVPLYSMNKLGIDPAKFFSKVTNAGSHENAVMAVQQGTCDLAFNWWNSENDSNLQRMATKGMVKQADFKIVFKSEKIAGYPYVLTASLPADLKAAIKKAFFDFPTKDKASFDAMFQGKSQGLAPTSHQDFKSTIELQNFVDALRKKSS
ncbi:MAG: phosphonate ABC transporter substrate-binding protein [Rhizobiales bacterium]|nr:phosphonate ABC transporter substrate-binding protein [Hyphomicrobiales bacterium]